MEWIQENGMVVLQIVGGMLGVLALICKLTPTPKDDKVIAKILTWFNMWPKNK